MELSFQLFRSLWFWSGIYLVGKSTVPQYWKLCYQQWSRNVDFFSLETGVGQGNPLSPYLFVVAAETLALAIRQKPEIIGIKIGGEETKLFQYADDTTAVLSDIDSAQALFNLLEVFKNLSGLVINSSKTEGMWIGSSRDKTWYKMAWLTNQSPWCLLLIRYQTFARKKFYWEIGQCQKNYKHLVFKRSFYLWKSNYQVFNHTKICLHFLASDGPQGNCT